MIISPIFLVYFAFPIYSYDVSTIRPLITPQNASEAILHCPPAEEFIQTNMAPDFETPQLVRRLDWFHDDTLVASYQQNVLDDSSRQWWVADKRFRLIRPFYALRVGPVLPEDAGFYRCRLETDPLFALTMSTAHVELAVMVRPVAPSSPEIKAVSNRSVTLSWNHSTAKAHRPILRYTVAVRSLSDDHKFVIPAPSNATSVIVDNLSPFNLYAFSVRAENAAGESQFGPETKQRTHGDAPAYPPRLVSVRNGSEGCILIEVLAPEYMDGDLKGITITTSREKDEQPKREHFAGPILRPFKICELSPNSVYVIAVTAENDFGLSPAVQYTFNTNKSVPQFSPTNLTVTSVVGIPKLVVRWLAPEEAQDIVRYNLYHKTKSDHKWNVEHFLLPPQKPNSFKHEMTQLAPNSEYHVRVSASTEKGEGPKSPVKMARTEADLPKSSELLSLSFDCKNGVQLKWEKLKGRIAAYRVELGNDTRTLEFNTTMNQLDVIDLSLHDKYSVRVAATILSVVDNSTLLQGPWGMEHQFLLSDHCVIHSSLCTAHTKCEKLVQASPPRQLSHFVAAASLCLFIILCFVVAYSLRGRCLDVKHMLKKKEKCVYLEELSPLVYDSTGCEDIPVELFYGYCEDLARNNNAKYKLQFEQIEQITSSDCTQPDELEKNLDKNRYLNIGAMETSRVHLNSASGSDYINANYIDSCDKRNAYIATQAPLPSTFSDFWAMIWQERCNIIVVITNMVEDGRRKCDQYWPANTQSIQTHGTYTVGLVSETSNAHFVHRILSLRIAKCVPPAERRIHQLHFTGWPDHGVPESVFPLLTFMNFVSDIHSTGPIVVHCSAGVGRSGSYILVDSMRQHLINFRKLNVMGHLIHMRRQREKLVQTVEQYQLCHEAVRQLIRHGITRVHSDLFQRYLHYLAEENVNGKTRMQMQYEDLCECHHNPHCPPPSDYIVLPGYHRQDEFIVASWTCETEQLWELVWNKNCQTIVLLSDDGYWSGIEQVGEMTVQHGENFALLQNNEDQLCVRIVPVSRRQLEKDFWGELERIQKERLAYHDAPLLILNPPLNIMSTSTRSVNEPRCSSEFLSARSTPSAWCRDEPSPSLAYSLCALTALACQLEQQGCIDVVQILSSYSRLHCGMWTSRADIEFIYDRLTVLVGGSRV